MVPEAAVAKEMMRSVSEEVLPKLQEESAASVAATTAGELQL